MIKPVYANNMQIFVAHGDKSVDGETTIVFNHVWRYSKHGHPMNPQTKEVDEESIVPGNGAVVMQTDTVASVVMNRDSLYQLRDSISSIIAQMEVDEKMRKLEG